MSKSINHVVLNDNAIARQFVVEQLKTGAIEIRKTNEYRGLRQTGVS